MIKKIKNILLFIPLLILLIIISVSCGVNVEKREQYESTKEVVNKKSITPEEQFIISSCSDITLGVLNYSTAASTFSHFILCDFDIYIYFNDNTNIYRADIVYTLNILDTNTFDIIESNYRRFSLSIPQTIPITELVSITVSTNLYGDITSSTFDNNLRARLILNLDTVNNNHTFIDNVYTTFSPTIRYLSWDYEQPGGYRVVDILGYSDMYTDGITNAYNTGYNTGYNVGYTTGNNVGYDDGYTDGYNDGENNTYNHSWLESIFNAVNVIFNIEIFPGFKLWFLIGAPLMVSLVVAVFKILR